MKILFLVPSLGSGGAERVISVLSNEMCDRGNDVTITLISNRTCVYSLSPDIKINYLDCDDYLTLPPVKKVLKRYQRIRDAVKNQKPDIVISFMSSTNIDVCLALAGLKVPVVVSERNDPKIDPPGKIKKIMRKFAYRFADGFVFQTPDAQAYFSKRIQKKSTVILNPLTENICDVYEGKRESKIAAVGRLNAQKNYPLLLNSFKAFSEKHPEYVLEIYGEGPQKEQIEEMIVSLGLHDKVKLLGFCKDVHEKIKDAAFYVMSSDFEGMPNALMEAMALGLPCISTDCPCGGPRMMIENNVSGILVPVNDTVALTEAMSFMANNREAAAEMGKEAAKIREKTNVNSIVDQWLDYISKYKK